jgi:hypothetical protein
MLELISILFFVGLGIGLLLIGYELLDADQQRDTRHLPALVLRSTGGFLLGVAMIGIYGIFVAAMYGSVTIGSVFLTFLLIRSIGFPVGEYQTLSWFLSCAGGFVLIALVGSSAKKAYFGFLGDNATTPLAYLKELVVKYPYRIKQPYSKK